MVSRCGCASARLTAPRALLLVAVIALPVASRSAVPEPTHRLAFDLALGPASSGAPQVMLGAGFALVETGRARVDLFGRAGFSEERTLWFDLPGIATGSAALQAISLHVDLEAAVRTWRLEPFAGVGLAEASAGGNFDYYCQGGLAPACGGGTGKRYDHVEGSWSGGPAIFGGARLVLTDQFLLAAELRYAHEGRSRFEELPVSWKVGGTSAFVSVLWRIPTAIALAPRWRPPPEKAPEPVPAPTVTPPTVRPLPPPPPLPPAPPPAPPRAVIAEACPGSAVPTIALHPRQRYRCFPDPVRGGHYCEAQGGASDHADRSACEAACLDGSPACPAGGAAEAACARCVEGCARTRLVPCPGTVGWTALGPACLLPAGAFGLPSERAVPATCPAGGGEP